MWRIPNTCANIVNMFGRVNDCAGGNVGRGTTCHNEKLTVEGAVSLDETTAPSASSGYGKGYVKSADSCLYYKVLGGHEAVPRKRHPTPVSSINPHQ